MTYGFGAVFRATLAAALIAGAGAAPAEARPGGGSSSFGSRGSQTFSAPPSTATAPRPAQPMQRTETPSVGRPGPSMPSAVPAQPRRFGFGTGLMAGLFGAGLIGMLTGHGFFGGLEGLMSMFGLLFQVALVVGLVWLGLRFLRRRSEPAFAGAGAPQARSMLGGLPGGSASGAPRPPARQPIEIGPADYSQFERLLGDVQTSYGRGDAGALGRYATPEMVRYLEQDLAADRQRGVRNDVSDPRLLQGDLAEAWREGSVEYATVAMRFSVVDVFRDLAAGKVVSGDPTTPVEATEIWTFRRGLSEQWRLSAIQQTA